MNFIPSELSGNIIFLYVTVNKLYHKVFCCKLWAIIKSHRRTAAADKCNFLFDLVWVEK